MNNVTRKVYTRYESDIVHLPKKVWHKAWQNTAGQMWVPVNTIYMIIDDDNNSYQSWREIPR
jgi:hypothetical protein